MPYETITSPDGKTVRVIRVPELLTESPMTDDEKLIVALNNRIKELIEQNAHDADADRACKVLLSEELDDALAKLKRLKTAFEHFDWGQISATWKPCCHIEEDGKFCGRSRYWLGHDTMHPFIEIWELFK